nr:unnamed protein product [Digitaria exilis]
MSATATDEAALEARLQALRQRLGKKQQFEEAVADLAALLRDRYAGASPALRKSMYSTVCRVATVLQTRYTAPGFWRAGLNLFVGTEKLGIIEHPPRAPPASKELVANLPVLTVTDEVIARLGSETECAVCRENLVVDDKMQELPCKHLFHPPCLKPWLDENNSCPICRYELRTDDHAYESRKEREKEEEEDRRGAANAVRGGEFMYI